MRDNLDEIIRMAKSKQVKVILQQMQIPTNYGQRYTTLFTNSYTELAAKHEVALLPFFLENIALDKSLMQRDGIHPNALAQPMIAKDMQQALGEIIFP